MQNNSKVGGVLTMVSGAFGFLWLVGSLFAALMMRFMVDEPYYMPGPQQPFDFFTHMAVFYIAYGLFFTVVGVFAIVGGYFALRKKYWGLALAGAIAGSVTFFPCGISAIIFVTLGKSEFATSKPSLPME